MFFPSTILKRNIRTDWFWSSIALEIGTIFVLTIKAIEKCDQAISR